MTYHADEQGTVRIAALLGFEKRPAGHEDDPVWMHEKADAAEYALHMEDLIRGAWAADGMFECAVWLEVPAEDPYAQIAAANTAIRGQGRGTE